MESARAVQRPADSSPSEPVRMPWSTWFASLPLKSLEMFCQRMSVGLGAGVDVIKLLESEKKQPRQSDAMSDMVVRLRRGESMAEAMQAQQGHFPKLLVQMVSAGEDSGRLEHIFGHMTEYYRDLRVSRNAFLQQVSWPVFQLGLALVVISGVILLQGILSRGDTGYDASGLGLRGWSGFVFFWFVVALMFGILGVTAFGIWKNWFQCHRLLIPWVRNIPVIGPVFTTLALSRMSMTLSMLLNAGGDAKRAVREAFKSTGNFYYMSGMKRATDEIEKGQSLAHGFEASGVLPREFIEAIELGELSGTETNSLDRLAKDYQARAKTALTILATSTSVFIWVCIAAFLVFMILSMALQYVNLLYSNLP